MFGKGTPVWLSLRNGRRPYGAWPVRGRSAWWVLMCFVAWPERAGHSSRRLNCAQLSPEVLWDLTSLYLFMLLTSLLCEKLYEPVKWRRCSSLSLIDVCLDDRINLSTQELLVNLDVQVFAVFVEQGDRIVKGRARFTLAAVRLRRLRPFAGIITILQPTKCLTTLSSRFLSCHHLLSMSPDSSSASSDSVQQSQARLHHTSGTGALRAFLGVAEPVRVPD
ncbi:hypothetical protein NEUTE2DRAFT_70137 [Neurospora tetrasperma FGSC 2509]|nr:hypothetical protein NEUTE2DRAFT_70137 [Neurospora tetrasperma FGSC 2509]